MKPRVLLSTGNYRIIDRGEGYYRRFVIEQGDGYDHMGVRHWHSISFQINAIGNRFLDEHTFTSIIEELGRTLRCRELRSRSRRRGLTLKQRIAAKRAKKNA